MPDKELDDLLADILTKIAGLRFKQATGTASLAAEDEIEQLKHVINYITQMHSIH